MIVSRENLGRLRQQLTHVSWTKVPRTQSSLSQRGRGLSRLLKLVPTSNKNWQDAIETIVVVK